MFVFKIIKVEYGWIEGKIGNDTEDYYFNYSYLTDFLSDLLYSIIAAERIDNDWGNYNSFITEWEPARDRWVIELDDEEYSVYINSVEIDDAEGRLRLNEIRGLIPVNKPSIKPNSFLIRCNRKEFLSAIVNECFEVLKKYGFWGYWKAFEKEFPIGKLLFVCDILENNVRDNTSYVEEVERLKTSIANMNR